MVTISSQSNLKRSFVSGAFLLALMVGYVLISLVVTSVPVAIVLDLGLVVGIPLGIVYKRQRDKRLAEERFHLRMEFIRTQDQLNISLNQSQRLIDHLPEDMRLKWNAAKTIHSALAVDFREGKIATISQYRKGLEKLKEAHLLMEAVKAALKEQYAPTRYVPSL